MSTTTNNNVNEVIEDANMATTVSDAILDRLMPKTFRKGDNLEEFITDCKRFLKYASYKHYKQTIVVGTFLDKKLLKDFEAVDPAIKEWETRLRTMFAKKTSFLEDWEEAFSYKQTSEDAVYVR